MKVSPGCGYGHGVSYGAAGGGGSAASCGAAGDLENERAELETG